MKINGEEVELVTDFATLRSGMVVWVKPCLTCNGVHRSFLLSHVREAGFREAAIWVLPMPKCTHYRRGALGESSVKRGIVYRVVDPKLTQTTARKREAVRP